jgi:quercetin dioxygenase-like cupin family protein
MTRLLLSLSLNKGKDTIFMQSTVDANLEAKSIRSIVAAPDFQSGLNFFVNTLEFRIAMISPADDPDYAVLTREQFTIALDKKAESPPLLIEIPVEDQSLVGTNLVGPNGTRVNYVLANRNYKQRENREPIINLSLSENADWVHGRAGMSYRSLIGAHNEMLIASQIRIEGSGKVKDWVHYHDVSFQTLICINGAAKLVYEDQGEPFLFEKGDYILQPPGIRHQVLESFNDLEVVEFTSPSDHATFSDFGMKLPNSVEKEQRYFLGQHFSHSSSESCEEMVYQKSDSLNVYMTPIAAASGNIGWVNKICGHKGSEKKLTPSFEISENKLSFIMWFVTDGSAEIEVGGRKETFKTGDAISYPYGFHPSLQFSIAKHDSQFQVLEIGFLG